MRNETDPGYISGDDWGPAPAIKGWGGGNAEGDSGLGGIEGMGDIIIREAWFYKPRRDGLGEI